MALTKIKTGGLTDNSVTDAKVADAITITGAQTGITQVGTLTAGVWNGTKVASAYLDDDTAHLSGSAFTGTISSSTSSTTDSALTLTDAGVADYKFTFPDTSTIRLSTSTSSTKVFDLSNAGSGKMKLSVDGGLRPITGSDYSLVLESTNELNFYNADGYADSNRATLHINYSGTGSSVDLANSELVVTKGTGSTFAGNITTTGSSITVDPPSGDAVLALQHSSQTLRIDQNSIRTTTNSALNLFTNNTNGSGMYIATDGNIGFNQTTPRAVSGYRLLTLNHATNGGGINFQQNGANYGAIYNVASDMYYDANTHHLFRTGGAMGGTTKFRINSNGFVGIGASPNALLDINKSTSSTDLPTANESFEGYRLILANPQLTNNATNALGFSMYNGEVCAYIATQTHYNGQYETDIIFGTRDDNRDDGIDDTVGDGLKEAFRIDHDSNIQFHGNMFGGGSKDAAPWNDSSGNGVLYYQKGTSALGATLALSTNVDVGGGYAGMYINLVGASASGDRMIAFSMDGSSAGQIHYSSSGAVAYATSGSDKRLKKNITNWTGDTLSKFANIEPKMFHWKTQDSSEDKIKGFIAQDMIENFPEAYPIGKMGEGDDQIERYQYNPSGMVIYLMKALKEQVAVNANLTSRIEALENA